MQLQTLKLSEISPSPTNPREDFAKAELLELSADIALRGLLQPILVRKKDKGFEIIAGERRYRATELAGEKAIQALVTEMTDLEAEEAQVVENEKRDNLKPLEKAKGYAGLIARHGMTADTLAEKLGKSRSTVYAVLRLNELLEPGRKALKEGTIPEVTAKLLSRIPASRQAKATKEVVEGRYPGQGTMSYRAALEHVQKEYMLDLRLAVFDTKDAQLVPVAGACGSCEKRTGAQPGLFDGEKVSADLCTDSDCWRNKLECHVENLAIEREITALSAKAGEKLFNKWGDLVSTEYVLGNAPHPGDAKGRRYLQLLKPDQQKAQGVLTINPKGELVELLKTEGLEGALEQSGKLDKRKAASKKSGSSSNSKRMTPEQKEKEAAKASAAAAEKEFRVRLNPLIVDAMVAAVEKRGLDKKMLQLVARLAIKNTDYTLDHRKVTVGAWQINEKTFTKFFGKYSPKQLAGLVFQCAADTIIGAADGYNYGGDVGEKDFLALAAEVGVNVKKLEASLLDAEAAEAKKAAKKKAA